MNQKEIYLIHIHNQNHLKCGFNMLKRKLIMQEQHYKIKNREENKIT